MHHIFFLVSPSHYREFQAGYVLKWHGGGAVFYCSSQRCSKEGTALPRGAVKIISY
jgi:hypothetical protein